MNRCLTLWLAFFMTLSTLAIPLRAAKGPREGTDSRNAMVCSNANLASLHLPGLLRIVGLTDEETAKSLLAPTPYVAARNQARYARQADGVSLAEGDIGITPESGIEILQERLKETQSELNAFEDLACRDDIAPGTLRASEIAGDVGEGV